MDAGGRATQEQLPKEGLRGTSLCPALRVRFTHKKLLPAIFSNQRVLIKPPSSDK